LSGYNSQATLLIICKQSKKIIVVRDPFGTRTIYYSTNNKLTIISTDISLIHFLHVNDRIMYSPLLRCLISFNKVLRFTKVWKIINSYTAATSNCVLIFNLTTKKFQIRRYYNPYEIIRKHIKTRSSSTLIEVFRAIDDNIKRILEELTRNGIRKLCVPASGGLDSTLILWYLHKESKRYGIDVVPLFINFENLYEKTLVDVTSEIIGVNVIEKSFKLRDLGSLYIDLMRSHFSILEYPREGDASLPYYLLAKEESSKRLKAMVSGDSGDATFCRYDYFTFYYVNQLLAERSIQ